MTSWQWETIGERIKMSKCADCGKNEATWQKIVINDEIRFVEIEKK